MRFTAGPSLGSLSWEASQSSAPMFLIDNTPLTADAYGNLSQLVGPSVFPWYPAPAAPAAAARLNVEVGDEDELSALVLANANVDAFGLARGGPPVVQSLQSQQQAQQQQQVMFVQLAFTMRTC